MNAIAEVRSSIQPQSSEQKQFEQLEVRFDADYGVMWHFMKPSTRPVFNLQLLAELRAFHREIEERNGLAFDDGTDDRINYLVLGSKVPGIYNLGGDLSLFRDAITRKDRERLLFYGRKCIENVYPWSRNLELPLTTIALVEGDALGGGFECAISASVLVAEESTRLGFPEVLFNLFPGMGAYSFLSRKVGRRITDELITGGNIYTARQLYDMGVVDVLAPDGCGEQAVYSFIKKHAKAANGRRAIETVRREVEPVTREELMRVVEIWADAALRLTERDLRMMDRLVRAQSKTAELELVSPSNVMPLRQTA
jgi:DSF synthase